MTLTAPVRHRSGTPEPPPAAARPAPPAPEPSPGLTTRHTPCRRSPWWGWVVKPARGDEPRPRPGRAAAQPLRQRHDVQHGLRHEAAGVETAAASSPRCPGGGLPAAVASNLRATCAERCAVARVGNERSLGDRLPCDEA